jgi:hypothetical protein
MITCSGCGAPRDETDPYYAGDVGRGFFTLCVACAERIAELQSTAPESAELAALLARIERTTTRATVN